ncbi:hypothetical protein DSAG12_03261 [Promethearchaeum syntrophicum]|uniref:Uncharacterized protein n=1 Tax=Promethearchaeum syntrophicum TaxID=2594042 RepID=A0A5B9DE84_9ARCH|nr:hypothetical protein [Candidatus Prometheoarchaeum syntrophicum]QEE17424.1 hypothetical protein DSAG12_03261 [Candidatus Prometheoarchaeum syntrophicum]
MAENDELKEIKAKKSNESLKTRFKFISEIILMIVVGFLVLYPLIAFGSNFLL